MAEGTDFGRDDFGMIDGGARRSLCACAVGDVRGALPRHLHEEERRAAHDRKGEHDHEVIEHRHYTKIGSWDFAHEPHEINGSTNGGIRETRP
jgi:hypothetical protein